jgi:hypothetical protein
MTIKVILIAGILLVGWFAFRRTPSASTLAMRRLVGVAIIIGGSILVLWPDITSWLARLVGVGRGTDLLFYACVLVFMFVSLSQSQRVHSLEQRVVNLTRELALMEAAAADRATRVDGAERSGEPG